MDVYEEDAAEEAEGEKSPESVPGEGASPKYVYDQTVQFMLSKVIEEKILSFDEASRCLSTLGKDESGSRYAYLMMTATDRKLTNIRTILNFKHVLFVDVGGNFLDLDGLQVLTEMPYLLLLKADRNIIESAALKPAPFLQVLDLSRNRVTETCDVNQPLLESLVLNFNEIYTAQFDPERLTTLKQLELRGNHLFDVSGMYPPNVENFYLAENRIKKFIQQDMARLTNLKILHLRDNNIRKLDGFSEALKDLWYLNLRKNTINKFRQFRKLRCLPKLDTIIVTDNPVISSADEKEGEGAEVGPEESEIFGEDGMPAVDNFRITLLVVLPNLKRINKLAVTLEERRTAEISAETKWREIMEEDSSEDEDELQTTTDFTTDYTTDIDGEGFEGTTQESTARDDVNPEA